MPLLQLLARLRTMATQPDPARLRQATDAGLETFERLAQHAGIAVEQVRRAHYALCASLDDVVLNTPWGSTGAWADHTLVAAHHVALRGDRFFDLLRQAETKGPDFLPLVELMHACLSLGYLGDRRHSAEGPAEAERARAGAHAFILQHAPRVPPELAGAWRGVHAPFVARRTALPVWVAASAGLAALAGFFLVVSGWVNDGSDQAFAAMQAAPPAHMPQIARDAVIIPPAAPPPPDAAEASALDRLRSRLGDVPDIAVVGTPEMPIVRIPSKELFGPGSATLLPAASALLEKVAAALRDEPGTARIIGYTDSQPFRSVRFASNFQLSTARAQAAQAVLASFGKPSRWSAEGRAAAAPIASNATVQGQEQNRRIDIVLNGHF